MNVIFTHNGLAYSGTINEEGNGEISAFRVRQYWDQYLRGTHKQVRDVLAVENFRAVIHGDTRYDLGEVKVEKQQLELTKNHENTCM